MAVAGYFPEESNYAYLPAFMQEIILRMAMSAEARIDFYSQIRMLMETGVGQVKALTTLLATETTRDGGGEYSPMAVILRAVVDRMSEGSASGTGFSDGLQPYIPDSEYILLKSCEAGSNLNEALSEAVKRIETNVRLKDIFIGLLGKMLFNIVAIVITMIINGLWVLPEFAKMYPMERWKGMGASLVWMSKFVNYGLLPTTALLAILVYVIWKTLPTWTGFGRSFADGFMPWSLYNMNAGVQFMTSLASMMSTGSTVSESLEHFSKTTRGWLHERVTAIAFHLGNGAENIGEAMHMAGHNFPNARIVQNLRSIASGSRNLEEAITVLNENWLKQQIKLVERKAAVFEQMVTLINILMVAWVLFGLQSVQDQMMQGMQGMGGMR